MLNESNIFYVQGGNKTPAPDIQINDELRTKLTRETLKSIREKKQDVYYHAQDIINLGMADEIIERK